jgi:fibrillarin-like pre-rRNA processing protein
MIQQSKLQGIYEERRGRFSKYYTKNLVKGQQVYTEKLIKQGSDEFRQWVPEKSKLGAGIYNGVSQMGIKPGSKVLYLGAATGTTCSHVSDILGESGELYALDFAPRTQRELVFLSETRSNMAPIFADAKNPEEYKDKIPEVDVVFQDVAQRDQVGIFLKNCAACLKKGGFGILAVKARSIDVTKRPKDVFREVREVLEKNVVIVDSRSLDPFEKDHYLFVIKK